MDKLNLILLGQTIEIPSQRLYFVIDDKATAALV